MAELIDSLEGAIALRDGCRVGPAPGGGLALIGPDGRPALDLAPADEGVVALCDGTRGAHEILRAAATIDPPRSPVGVLRLLRRIARKGLLVGVAPPPASIAAPRWSGPPAARPSVVPAPPRRAPIAIALPAALIAPPIRLPVRALDGALAIASVAIAVLAAAAAARGELATLVDPFGAPGAPGVVLALAAAGAIVACSARGLARGLALRALGLAVPRSLVVLRGIVPCLDVDDAARAAAPASDRAAIARAGLAGLAVAFAALALAHALGGPDAARPMAAGAAIALLAELAPYRRTDARHLAGLRARIPQQGARATSFLLRRVLANVGRAAGPSRIERAYLGVATAWLAHGLAALVVVEAVLAPSAIGLVARAWGASRAHPTAVAQLALAAAALAALGVFAALIALVAGLVALLVGVVRQGLGRARPSAPAASRPADATDAARVAVMLRRLPPFAALSAASLDRLAGAARVDRHPRGAILRVAGRRDEGLAIVLSGATQATVVEESGLEHPVEPPGPGDAWGEPALVGPADASTTVRATGEVDLARIDRAAIDRAIEGDPASADLVAGLGDLACLRAQVAFASVPSSRLARLVEASRVTRFEPGAALLDEYDRAGALFVLREGACRVTGPRGAAIDLGPGDVVGELALLGGAAPAGVVAIAPTTALRLDARAVARVLLEDPRATAALEALAAERHAFVGAP